MGPYLPQPCPSLHQKSIEFHWFLSFPFPFLVILPLAYDIGPDLHCNSLTTPFSSKGSRATNPIYPCGSVGLCHPPSGFPNPQQFTHLLNLLEQNLLSNTPHSYGGWMKPKCWMDFVGAGSGLCLAKHQLSWAVLTHFTCQHGRTFLPCNQRQGRDSLFCQLSIKSNSASSSDVGGNTNQWPWLLMTPRCSKDLKFISKASDDKAIYLWQLLFALLEQWLHPSLAKTVQPGGWKWADVAGSCAGERQEFSLSTWCREENWERNGRAGIRIRTDIVDFHMVYTVSINLGELPCTFGGEVQ